MDQLYARGDLRIIPFGSGRSLVHSHTDGSTRMLPDEIARLLGCCGEFASLDGQVERCMRELGLPVEARAEVEQALHALANAGLLVPMPEMLGRIVAGKERPARSSSADAPRITTFGMITCNRPSALDRGLRSYAENARKHSRDLDFVVMDDSRDPNIRTDYGRLLERLKKDCGIRLFYAGEEEKSRYVGYLARESGVPREVIEFAISDPKGCTYREGTNRNGLFLHSAGECLFTADDDTICRVVRAPGDEGGLGIRSEFDPTEVWLYPGAEELLSETAQVNEDLLALHERLLGRGIGECIAAEGARPVDIGAASAGFLDKLSVGAGRVMISWTGIYGDSGATYPTYYLWKGPFQKEQLTRSEALYPLLRDSRQILRAGRKTLISDGSYCQSTALAFDNRRIISPFVSVQRGHDIAFGQIFRTCFREGYIGYLPWAIQHSPIENRKNYPEDIEKSAQSPKFHSLMSSAIASFSVPKVPAGPEAMMRLLGRHLAGIGAMPTSEFSDFIRTQAWTRMGQRIASLEWLMNQNGSAPGFWADDIRRYISAQQRAALSEGYGVPSDIPQQGSNTETIAFAQRLIAGFGRALEAWPELVTAAKALRTKGIRLAREI